MILNQTMDDEEILHYVQNDNSKAVHNSNDTADTTNTTNAASPTPPKERYSKGKEFCLW